jgi:hypothetical protein
MCTGSELQPRTMAGDLFSDSFDVLLPNFRADRAIQMQMRDFKKGKLRHMHWGMAPVPAPHS